MAHGLVGKTFMSLVLWDKTLQ